ncbi:hypothetical protein NQ317_013850 [Molorchus minor]|uniref:Uncharacterized protein n=1 Tax=Molorchus minor TaxID=1323400 RepID=A0ABQ9J3P6_9CUCU|nr:hypothetical protein NQ317_013850 [Molorchus minor]
MLEQGAVYFGSVAEIGSVAERLKRQCSNRSYLAKVGTNNTCHNLLCNNCDSAHHYMRCFESHKVVALDDMRKDGTRITIHKPLECDIHSGENIIYNCTICNVTAWENVLKMNTKVISVREYWIQKPEFPLTGLNNNMEELAHQRSAARDLINESYQSYKAVLEKCKDEALEELNKLYHERN